MSGCAAIILAAGAARRWQHGPKLLADWRGRPLLDHVCAVAQAAGARPVLRVLGAHREAIEAGTKGEGTRTVFNPDWAAGLGSSLAAGARALLAEDNAGPCVGVWLLLGDQPRVSERSLHALRTEFERTGRGLLFSALDKGQLGPPAFVSRAFWPALANLSGEQGAKALTQAHPEAVGVVPTEDCLADVDTLSDYVRLSGRPD